MQDLEFIFSKQRLEHYKDINEHFENLELISKIMPKIAMLEIYLRNALDYELSSNCKEWIKTSDNPFLLAKINEFKDKDNLEHHQILSRLENLLKIRENDNKIYPRISTKEKGTNIGLMPGKIENFLNDLICLINEDLLDYLNRG
ncbi:hypothetical protein ACTFDJ_00245 [Campylobacter jejuni]